MKKYLLFLFFSAMLADAMAQISIQPVLPLAGIIQKNNLWNIAVINTSSITLNCRLELTLRDRKSGLEVMTATTGQFQIGAGAKQLNVSQLMPVQYNYISTNGSARTDDFVPIGDYTACYRLTGDKNILAEECVSFDVEPLSPPMLISPADSSILPTQPTQFTWIPPAPLNLFSRLDYEVMVTEILPGQKAEEAMQQNVAFYTEPNIPVNNLAYRGMASSFEKDKWYAWQVVARDDKSYAGKSEVWVFSVKQESQAEKIIKGMPFVKLKMNDADMAIAPNGILKLSYDNRNKDTTMKVTITDMSDVNSKTVSFTTAIVQGENLVQYNLKKIIHPSENKTYQAIFTNSQKEKWMLVFRIKYFKD